MNAKALPPSHAVILCHPDRESFNASVAERYCEAVQAVGHKAIIRDLYRIDFDPVLKPGEQSPSSDRVVEPDVAAEIAEIRSADVFVFVYPIWFGTPPAMLKGYVERVFGAGFDHRAIRERRPHTYLAGKHLLSLSSSGNSIQWLEEQGAWLSLRNAFDTYLATAFSMASSEHIHFSNIVEGMTPHNVDAELVRVTEIARKTCAALI